MKLQDLAGMVSKSWAVHFRTGDGEKYWKGGLYHGGTWGIAECADALKTDSYDTPYYSGNEKPVRELMFCDNKGNFYLVSGKVTFRDLVHFLKSVCNVSYDCSGPTTRLVRSRC